MRPKTLEGRSEIAGGRTAAQTASQKGPPAQGPRIVGYRRAEAREDPTALAGPQGPQIQCIVHSQGTLCPALRQALLENRPRDAQTSIRASQQRVPPN